MHAHAYTPTWIVYTGSKPLKGLYMGDSLGEYYWGYYIVNEFTRSLDCSSLCLTIFGNPCH